MEKNQNWWKSRYLVYYLFQFFFFGSFSFERGISPHSRKTTKILKIKTRKTKPSEFRTGDKFICKPPTRVPCSRIHHLMTTLPGLHGRSPRASLLWKGNKQSEATRLARKTHQHRTLRRKLNNWDNMSSRSRKTSSMKLKSKPRKWRRDTQHNSNERVSGPSSKQLQWWSNLKTNHQAQCGGKFRDPGLESTQSGLLLTKSIGWCLGGGIPVLLRSCTNRNQAP